MVAVLGVAVRSESDPLDSLYHCHRVPFSIGAIAVRGGLLDVRPYHLCHALVCNEEGLLR
jgi:hypothetical protein